MTAHKSDRHDAGTSFVEIMVAMAILALTIVPIYEFYTRISEVPAVSEDVLYAEVLSTRILERYGSFAYADLEAMTGQTFDNVLESFFNEDREEVWFGELPEYTRNLGISKHKFKGTLTVSKVEDGLIALDLSIRWSPSSRGSNIKKESTYTLLKFVSRADLGIRYQDREPQL